MGENKSVKNRLTFRPSDETRQRIEQWYRADNCSSLSDFVEKAVNDYIDRLVINGDNRVLPTAITSAIDGRLGLLEKNLSSLSFNHAVELDRLVSIVAEAFNFSREDKETNVKLSCRQSLSVMFFSQLITTVIRFLENQLETKALFLIKDSEIVQILFETILCGEHGIGQISVFTAPLFQSAVIE